MGRPPCCRRIAGKPIAAVFNPAGIPVREVEGVVMSLDEFEALRLADLEGLYQEQAAGRMGVSRPTFGRILESAHRKVAEVLVRGAALRIEGGPVVERGEGPRRCPRCASVWTGSCGCPHCRRRGDAATGTRRAPREETGK